jgi:hypothetical protein
MKIEEESHVSSHWKKNDASSLNNVEQRACEYQIGNVRKCSLSISPCFNVVVDQFSSIAEFLHFNSPHLNDSSRKSKIIDKF